MLNVHHHQSHSQSQMQQSIYIYMYTKTLWSKSIDFHRPLSLHTSPQPNPTPKCCPGSCCFCTFSCHCIDVCVVMFVYQCCYTNGFIPRWIWVPAPTRSFCVITYPVYCAYFGIAIIKKKKKKKKKIQLK